MMDLQLGDVPALQVFMWIVGITLGLFITAVVFTVGVMVCYGGAASVGKLFDALAADRRLR